MEIQEIRARLSIETVLSHLGLQADSRGNMRCPLHDDKKASMKVYFDSNTVRCFSGNCEHGGKVIDQIDLLMLVLKISKREAILLAKQLVGHVPAIKKAKSVVKTTTQLTLDEVFTQSFVNGFNRTKKAQEYALKRGLNPLELELGYSSGQLHYHKPESYVNDLEALGLLIPLKNGHQSFGKNCLIFPLKNEKGIITGMYSRRIDKPGHYYLKNRSGLYPGYPAKETEKLILAESVIDAASLLQLKELSEYSILALYGTNGLTSEHKQALKALPKLKEITIMLDGDEAGRKAAATIKAELQQIFSSSELLPEIHVIDLPENTDVNELWVNHQSAELFKDLLKTEAKSSTRPTTPKKLNGTGSLNTNHPHNWIWQGQLGEHSIKGGVDLKKWDSLKVTWVLATSNGLKSRQKLDLYDDRQVEKACEAAAKKLRLPLLELEKELNQLTNLLEGHRNKLGRAREVTSQTATDFSLSATGRQAAIDYLYKPDLLERLNKAIGQTGIVGEEQTRLMLLLIASSHKTSRPLHALIQGSSGSGKTLLLRKILKLIPDQDRFLWSRVTESSLYNWGDRLRHKLVGIEDWDGLKEEAQYALRELQSGGQLSSSTSEKQENGKIEAEQRITQGPIASLMCTTKGTVYEDNMSRCFLVAIDESNRQTQRIIHYQNQLAEGILDRGTELQQQQFIQSLVKVLEPLEVVNPFASKVKLPPRAHKLRRLNQLYQDFVRQVVWWHQYQRKRDKRGRVVAQPADLQQAANLMFDSIVLKVDELDGSLRQFFEKLKDYVLKQEAGESYQFGRLEVRQALRVSKTQQHRFFNDLEQLEYIRMVHQNRYKGHQYQVTFWDDYEGMRSDIKATLNNQIAELQ